MKKTLKKALLLLLTAGLVCSLCGCKALQEMREAQAFLQEDGTVTWRGNTYRQLPESDLLEPQLDVEERVYLTEPDVPVLLSQFLTRAYNMYASEDGLILYSLGGVCYCREDVYDNLAKRLTETFKPDLYCYYYDVFDEEEWEFTEHQYTLTAAEVKALELITSTVTPYSGVEKGVPQDIFSVELYGCSEDLLLQQQIAQIIVTDKAYYLVVDTDTDWMVFPVPAGMNATFNQMLETYRNAMDGGFQAEDGVIT